MKANMLIQEGKFYATQRGRVIGPVMRMKYALTETYWHDDYFEPGLWDMLGRCHPETKTGYSYGNLISETVQPKQEEEIS